MSDYPESDVQFLARMLIQHREGDQFSTDDARRLQELADFGRTGGHQTTSTLPEERRDASKLPSEAGTRDVVRG